MKTVYNVCQVESQTSHFDLVLLASPQLNNLQLSSMIHVRAIMKTHNENNTSQMLLTIVQLVS